MGTAKVTKHTSLNGGEILSLSFFFLVWFCCAKFCPLKNAEAHLRLRLQTSLKHILTAFRKVPGASGSARYLVLLNTSTDRQTFDCVIRGRNGFELPGSASHLGFLKPTEGQGQIRGRVVPGGIGLSSHPDCVHEPFAIPRTFSKILPCIRT